MPEAPSQLLALLDAGGSLLRRTASGRVLLARYRDLVEPEGVPERLREAVVSELDSAYAAVVEPFDPKTFQKAVPKPIKAVSGEPLAVTPTAQVHSAQLDGEAVAVKVARPGVAATIRGELALLDILAAPLRVVFGALDVGGVLGEVRETVMDELDLEHEADTQQRVRRALRRVDGVTVPHVHMDECAPNVLVTELLEGPTLGAGVPEDPQRVAQLLVEAHLAAWREAGLVLSDARPSHVVLRPDGSIGLLGTGLARPVSRDRMHAAVRAFAALGDADPAPFMEAVAALEVLPGDAAEDAHALLREVLGELVAGRARLDADALSDLALRAFGRIDDLLRLGALATPDPADLAALRMLVQLTATLARLRVAEDWPALAARAASAGARSR